jgi:hypothetical protein
MKYRINQFVTGPLVLFALYNTLEVISGLANLMCSMI